MDRRLMIDTGAGKSDMNGWTDGVAYTDINVVWNEYVGNNGVFTHYNGWSRTGYVPCDGASYIKVPNLSGTGSNSAYNAFYTENKGYIKTFSVAHGTGYTVVEVPANASYFALSETHANLTSWLTDGVIPVA